MTQITPGDRLPGFDVDLPGGETFQLPALEGGFSVLLLFRGAWCPYCYAQLRAFERSNARLLEAGVSVVALSVEDEATTRALVAEHGLSFPVGHSADADRPHDLLGAFVHDSPRYVQSTGFVLDPSGAVASASTPAAPSGACCPTT